MLKSADWPLLRLAPDPSLGDLGGPLACAYLRDMAASNQTSSHFTGMMLIAMPGMADTRFSKAVVYICSHSEEGAMGIVVNQVIDQLRLPAVLQQLGIEGSGRPEDQPVHVGGPVESNRGFVLHSAEYRLDSTLVIDENFALTATVEILRAIAEGKGPSRLVLALGYAGWAPGQLDAEILDNGWLIAPGDADIVFDRNDDNKWNRALAKLKVDPILLSGAVGHA
jgi:putative transcriptional regulator